VIEASFRPSVVVVDYGMGNLRSVQKALEKVGCDAAVSSEPRAVERAPALVLPGVGAFRDCMDNLTAARLVEPLRSGIAAGKPFLGICLGMQLLLTVSEEFGVHRGLDVVPGRVVRFPRDHVLPVPHMGWNRVHFAPGIEGGPHALFAGIPDGSFFYFVHSYHAAPADEAAVAARTDYGVRFCSALARGNVFAVQFHPEKSQRWGLQLLANFRDLVLRYSEGRDPALRYSEGVVEGRGLTLSRVEGPATRKGKNA
jgi:glutamine amidotransferase